MKGLLRRWLLLALSCLCWSGPARALTASWVERRPAKVGEPLSLELRVEDAHGDVEFRWDFGDGVRSEFTLGENHAEHTWAAAGHYPVIVVVRDEQTFTSASFVQTVHYPLTPGQPRASSSIVYDPARKRVYVANPDDDTISSVDADTLEKLGEVEVYRRPEALALAPDGSLWVLHRDDWAVAVVDLDEFEISRGFRLPYASQPIGLVMSPTGDAAWVTLLALGRVLCLDPSTGEELGSVEIGPWTRGLAVSHDGRELLVTRFLSADAYGEVAAVDTAKLAVTRRFELLPDLTEDSAQRGRGLPNYLFSVAYSPDGRRAWVPAKKDNIARGSARDGLPLTHDSTVRAMVSALDLAATEPGADLGQEAPAQEAPTQEALAERMDLDDRSLPVHVEFSPLGDYAFATLAGSATIEVRETANGGFVTSLQEAGIAPRASVLAPDGKLFVHGFLSRSVVVYDVSRLISERDSLGKRLAEVPLVAREKLPEQVRRGKRIFYDARDPRMSNEGYISCASCHFDGFEDGRVWDLTHLGEGLRNTTSLLGRRGMGHGPVHWSGNFDEIQDFEQPIRGHFGGAGFLPAEVPLGSPLGEPKVGKSAELDALAAYVTSLDAVHPSPHRSPDGSFTASAERGEVVFFESGCDECHAGPDFTDSALGLLHDVGTLRDTSGHRLGEELHGIDTPTLLGVWETAPYLHDGSAPTLRDVLSTRNPSDQHGHTSHLDEAQLDDLVAYLSQLDGDPEVRLLPFEQPTEPADSVEPAVAGCGCVLSGEHVAPARAGWLLLLVWGAALRRRLRRS
ncbi:MAG TPA: PKD domain-containing protein [Polyangiaceae bacterium]|nr:PKD domain-containing protein [Polyangiaceae bacterium]